METTLKIQKNPKGKKRFGFKPSGTLLVIMIYLVVKISVLYFLDYLGV